MIDSSKLPIVSPSQSGWAQKDALEANRQKYLALKRNKAARELAKDIMQDVKKQMTDRLYPDVNLSNALPERRKDRVFIVAGGPSLKDFPFYKLQNEDIIAINKSALHVPDPYVFITMDYTLLNIEKYKKINDLDDLLSKADNNVFILNQSEPGRLIKDGKVFKDSKFNMSYDMLYHFDHIYSAKQTLDAISGFGSNLDKFCHGDNSGFCGVQLAILMGYKEIYMLGFDMHTNWGVTHYHEGYGSYSRQIIKDVNRFADIFKTALEAWPHPDILYGCSATSAIKDSLQYIDQNEIIAMKGPVGNLDDLMIVGFYTKGTLYETEAQKTIESCKRWNLNHDIVGVEDFGGWQANTRYKAKFMREMLDKHPDKRLLYVDCDAIIQQEPTLFKDYQADIAVRWQDFRWRKNECLSGTIYMENNERTKELCERWMEINANDPDQVKNIEQWNLDKIISAMKPEGLRVQCLPPEYTFIFDHMKRIYPRAVPVIEHFQASRKARKKG